MPGPLYASIHDVHRQGLPPGSLVARARVVSAVDVATSTFELEGHGFASNDLVRIGAESYGAIPEPLTPTQVYRARPVPGSSSLFRVAIDEVSAPLTLSSAGAHPVTAQGLIDTQIEALLEVYSRWVDAKLIGHEVPLLAPYPAFVTHIVAIRTAAQMARALGLGSQAELVFQAEDKAVADLLGTLGKGTPLRDSDATGPSNRARYALAGSAAQCRGTIP